MRSFAIAFLVVFALGFASALAFSLASLAGVTAIGASVVIILAMSVVGAAAAGPPEPPLNLLMTGPHWSVRDVGDWSEFFRALPELAPPNSFLALADGEWDKEIRDELSKAEAELGDPRPSAPMISSETR